MVLTWHAACALLTRPARAQDRFEGVDWVPSSCGSPILVRCACSSEQPARVHRQRACATLPPPARTACADPALRRAQSAAVAYMECVVASRMEGADHWVVLAHVNDGAVMQPDARTAVHHRKVGSYY